MAGSMRELHKGVWTLRVSTGRDSLTGKYGQRSRTFHGTKTEAGIALAAFVTEIDRQPAVTASGRDTMDSLLDDWLSSVKGKGRSPVTLAGYRQNAAKHVRPALGHRKVRDLRTKDIEKFYTDLAASGKSASLIKQVAAVVGGALALATKWEMVPHNVALGADRLSIAAPKRAVPTPDDVAAIVAKVASTKPQFAAMLRLAEKVGPRRSELVALRWSDVDTTERTVSIHHTIVNVGGHAVARDTTKGKKARLVPLSVGAMDALEWLANDQARCAREAGVDLPADGYLLSKDGMGNTPRTPDWVTRQFKVATDALGLPYSVHSMRRYTATQMAMGGANMRQVADHLGNTPDVAMDHYTGSSMEAARAAAAIMDNVTTTTTKPAALPAAGETTDTDERVSA